MTVDEQRHRLRVVLPAIAAASAVVPALVLTVAVERSGSPWRTGDAVLLAAYFWLLFVVVLAAPFAALAIVSVARRRAPAIGDAAALAVTTLFALLWYERLKPLELWTVRYRPAAFDAGGLLMTALVVAAGYFFVRTATSLRSSAMRAVAAVLIGSAVLMAYVRAFEAPPSRTEPARRLAQLSKPAGAAQQSPASQRVLFIGVDGLDWAAVERLIAQHRLPHIEQLVTTGRSYELDADGLLLSPEIWTAMYTGRRPSFSGYVEWNFLGLSRSVDRLPPFGYRPMWGANKWLWRTTALGLWTPTSISTDRLRGPAFWRIASARGLNVAVFNPVPYEIRGEELNGVFAWEHDDVYDAHWKNGARPPSDERVPFPGEFRQTAAESLEVERRRSMLAGAMLERAHPALAVYYTQAADEISHWDWPSARDFDRSVVASAYEEADRSIGILVKRFGAPQTVVLASDHGWEFSPYQHERVPHGMLIIGGAGLSGFGGTAPVRAVAPTVLSLLGLATDAAGATALAGVPSAGLADYSATIATYLDDPAGRPPEDLRQRLKSLGYIAW